MTVAQRLNGCVDDVIRGPKIRLSDAEVDDVATGVLEGFGSGQDFEGGLGT